MSAFGGKADICVATKQKAPDDAGALNFIRLSSDQYFALTAGALPHGSPNL